MQTENYFHVYPRSHVGLDQSADTNHYLSRTLDVMREHPDLTGKEIFREVARHLGVVPHVAKVFVTEVRDWLQKKKQHQARGANYPDMQPKTDNDLDKLIEFLERLNRTRTAHGIYRDRPNDN